MVLCKIGHDITQLDGTYQAFHTTHILNGGIQTFEKENTVLGIIIITFGL